MDTYKILRFFKDDAREARVIKRGISLTEAQAHCTNPESESSFWEGWDDAELNPEGHGVEWFDGYCKDDDDRDVPVIRALERITVLCERAMWREATFREDKE